MEKTEENVFYVAICGDYYFGKNLVEKVFASKSAFDAYNWSNMQGDGHFTVVKCHLVKDFDVGSSVASVFVVGNQNKPKDDTTAEIIKKLSEINKKE